MLDAAITPYRAPRWLTRGFSLRNYLVIRFAQRHLALIRRAFPAQRFGQAAVEDVCMILGRMDRRDVWRVFDSCFHYPLPKRLQTAARVSYWYGSKEYFQRALNIRHVRRLLPETAFVAFPDCAHAEFVAGQPEAFAARLAETLELDGSDFPAQGAVFAFHCAVTAAAICSAPLRGSQAACAASIRSAHAGS